MYLLKSVTNLISIDRKTVTNLFLQQLEQLMDWLFCNVHGFLDSQTVRTIYISVIHVAAKVSPIYTCVQNLRTPSNTGKYSVFRIDSSIHFISRLLTAIFPTTNHLGTFAAWDSARSFFPHFYQPSPTPSAYLAGWLCSNWSTKRGRYWQPVSESNRPRRN